MANISRELTLLIEEECHAGHYNRHSLLSGFNLIEVYFLSVSQSAVGQVATPGLTAGTQSASSLWLCHLLAPGHLDLIRN